METTAVVAIAWCGEIMAFVALTGCTITIEGANSRQRLALSVTKASAVGFVTFSRDSQTFVNINEPFYVVDAYTGDAVNAGDYLEIYNRGISTGRRILGGIMKTAPTGSNRLMEGVIPAGQTAFYWYSA